MTIASMDFCKAFFRRARLTWLLSCILAFSPCAIQADELADAHSAISKMLVKLDALTVQQDLEDKALASRFARITNQNLEIKTMAREAIGHDKYSKLSPGIRAQYQGAFRSHLAHGFILGMRRSGPVTSEILGVRNAPNGAAIVASRSAVGGRNRDTLWLMCRSQPTKICDVEVDGVRGSAKHRSILLPVLESRGLDALITGLRTGEMARRAQ